jgi:hypothetical protein
MVSPTWEDRNSPQVCVRFRVLSDIFVQTEAEIQKASSVGCSPRNQARHFRQIMNSMKGSSCLAKTGYLGGLPR